MIRDLGRWQTVAGGIVVDQAPGHMRRGDTASIAALRAREPLRGHELAAHILSERNIVDAAELCALVGTSNLETDALDAEPIARFFVARSQLPVIEDEAAALVASHHRDHPLAAGMPVEDLRRELGLDTALFGELASRWQNNGVLVRDGAVIHRPDHGSALTPEQRSLADRAIAALRDARGSPPGLREVGVSIEVAKVLERNGELVLLTQDIGYPADVWSDIERRVVAMIVSNGPASVAAVRDAVGTSRKYAVPLLEKLDATGVTRRHGDVRELGPRGRRLSSGA